MCLSTCSASLAFALLVQAQLEQVVQSRDQLPACRSIYSVYTLRQPSRWTPMSSADTVYAYMQATRILRATTRSLQVDPCTSCYCKSFPKCSREIQRVHEGMDLCPGLELRSSLPCRCSRFLPRCHGTTCRIRRRQPKHPTRTGRAAM